MRDPNSVTALPWSILLRPVEEADTEFLFEVYSSTRAEELAAVAWDDRQKEMFLRHQFNAQKQCYQTNYPGAEFHIVAVDGKSAGRLYLHRRPAETRIMDVALLPEYRRKGIGTFLLKKVLREAAEKQKPVTIHVENFNPALRLYQRLGFSTISGDAVYRLMEWSAGRSAVKNNHDPRPVSVS